MSIPKINAYIAIYSSNMKKQLSVIFLTIFTFTSSTKDWKLGVQLWTFSKFDFVTAISKVDSSGVKYIEAYSHQKLGGGRAGDFGPDMTAEEKTQVKQLLKSKGIHIVAMGVIVPK